MGQCAQGSGGQPRAATHPRQPRRHLDAGIACAEVGFIALGAVPAVQQDVGEVTDGLPDVLAALPGVGPAAKDGRAVGRRRRARRLRQPLRVQRRLSPTPWCPARAHRRRYQSVSIASNATRSPRYSARTRSMGRPRCPGCAGSAEARASRSWYQAESPPAATAVRSRSARRADPNRTPIALIASYSDVVGSNVSVNAAKRACGRYVLSNPMR